MRMPFKHTTPIIDTQEEERAIVQAVLQGDTVEFQILVRRYHKPIYNLMFRVLKDIMTAEDLTQETFTRAYEKLGTFRTGKRFFPWIYAIGLNLCKDYLRKQGRHSHLFSDNAESDELADPGGDDCQKNVDRALEVQQVARALEKLPLLYSEPMLLYYREGLTLREISDVLNVSAAAVKIRIHRGREKIKRSLGVNHG